MKKFERLSAICLTVLFYCSCSDVVSLDTLSTPEEFIEIPNEVLLSGRELDEEQQELFNEARARFLSHVETTDESVYFIDKTAAEIHICQELYDLFYIVYVTLPNTRESCLQDNITKSGGVGCVWENADTVDIGADEDTTNWYTLTYEQLCYLACQTVEDIVRGEGWNTTADLFHDWYANERSETYTLNALQWYDVKKFAEEQARINSWGPGKHQISFYNGSNKDLGFAYGIAWVEIDVTGHCIGFSDTYDMNPEKWGVRSVDAEVITRVLALIGQRKGGFSIQYP